MFAVDVESRFIKQWPSLGVRTKNRKQATTYLLDIPKLIDVIEDWDQMIRGKLPSNGYWFAPLDCHTRDLLTGNHQIGDHRDARLRKDLKRWLFSVQIPYSSPKSFRHSHALFGRINSSNSADYKSVSSNLMHSSIVITDSVYGFLGDEDIRRRIVSLGKLSQVASSEKELFTEFDNRLRKLEMNQMLKQVSMRPEPTVSPDQLQQGQLSLKYS